MTELSQGLLETEAECAEGRTAPRVSLADIEAEISTEFSFTAGDALSVLSLPDTDAPSFVLSQDRTNMLPSLDILTVCIIVLRNGFTVIGKSAPASPANFDAALGAKLAKEDAIRQIWPLMGYALRERLSVAQPFTGDDIGEAA